MNTVFRLFNYRFYLKEFILLFFGYFLMEGIFSWIFIRNSVIIEGYEKIAGILIYGFMLYSFNNLKRNEKIYLGIFTFLILRLVFESLMKYDSFFRQLTMYTVLFPVIFAFFIKYILRSFNMDLLEFMAKFYLFTYIAFMLLFGRGFSFSLDSVDMNDYGPFSGDTRIIHASHILMMIIPFLWYLNQFIMERKLKFLVPLLFCFVIILVHQHRSVWSSTLFATIIYFIAIIRTRSRELKGLWQVGMISVLIMVIAYFFVASLYPGFLNFMGERFSEILDPSKEGSTGNFRLEQTDVYMNLFWQHPFFGWTFEGFSMPNPLVDWWPENSGQHFHEGYVEMLFYHGIAGFLFKYTILVYLLFKSFSRKISEKTIIMIAFSVSGLVFSFTYVLPLIFWGHVGMCLFYLDNDMEPETEEADMMEAEDDNSSYALHSY